MVTKLLINPNTQEISAKITQTPYGKELTVLDKRIMVILINCGINVPRDFTPDRSCHIFPDNPDKNLFAVAFEKHFFPHGLAQKGFYWIKEENYNEPSNGLFKDTNDIFAKKHVLGLF
ncbi:MAG: hypothetical protein KDK96_10550 [Chlamydiia bacterium]|nr:hypothetical protein [Chlamydiia bacterium]